MMVQTKTDSREEFRYDMDITYRYLYHSFPVGLFRKDVFLEEGGQEYH